MTFDHIIANPPYGKKLGVDITNKILNDIEYKDISILGTNAMLGKHNDRLALEYVYIEGYTLSPITKCPWVHQLVLLGHKGSCTVIKSVHIPRNAEVQPNEIRIPFNRQGSGQVRVSIDTLLVRNRNTSIIITISDKDMEYVKAHWNTMNYVERFWWLVEHRFYKKYIINEEKQ
mgnify:FL=1